MGRHFYHFRLQIPWVQGQRKSWVRAEVVICIVASMCSVVHLCTVAHRGHATFFLSRNKIKTSRDNFIIYRAINGKHGGSRNRLSRTLFPWTTMTATVEEVCFEVNSSFYLSKNIILQYFAILLRHIALWIRTVNLDFAKSYETLPGMAVNVWEREWII